MWLARTLTSIWIQFHVVGGCSMPYFVHRLHVSFSCYFYLAVLHSLTPYIGVSLFTDSVLLDRCSCFHCGIFLIELVFLYAFLGELWIVPFLQVVIYFSLGFSLYTDLSLWFFFSCHSIHFLGHRRCNVVFHFRSLFMIIVSCYLVPTCLCITLCLTRLWVCHCSLWSISVSFRCGRSQVALFPLWVWLELLLFPPPFFPFWAGLPSGIPLGRLKNSFWTEWKSIF